MFTNVNKRFAVWIQEQIEWLQPEVDSARSILKGYGLTEEQIDRCASNDLLDLSDVKAHLIENNIIADEDEYNDFNDSAIGEACIHTHHLDGILWAKEELETGSDLFWITHVLDNVHSITYEDRILQRQVLAFNARFNKSPSVQLHYLRELLNYEIDGSECSGNTNQVGDLVRYGFKINATPHYYGQNNQNLLRGFAIMETKLHVFNSESITENDKALLSYLAAHGGEEFEDRNFMRKVMVILHAWAEGEDVLYTVLGC